MTPSLDRAVEAANSSLIAYYEAHTDDNTASPNDAMRAALLAAIPHLSPGVVELLSGLKRFDARIVGGCECCGTWVEYEEEKTGEVVMWRDILALIDNKQESSS